MRQAGIHPPVNHDKRYADLKPVYKHKPFRASTTEIQKGETLRFLKGFGADPSSIVIELTEHRPTDDYELMRKAVSHSRNMRFEIALTIRMPAIRDQGHSLD